MNLIKKLWNFTLTFNKNCFHSRNIIYIIIVVIYDLLIINILASLISLVIFCYLIFGICYLCSRTDNTTSHLRRSSHVRGHYRSGHYVHAHRRKATKVKRK